MTSSCVYILRLTLMCLCRGRSSPGSAVMCACTGRLKALGPVLLHWQGCVCIIYSYAECIRVYIGVSTTATCIPVQITTRDACSHCGQHMTQGHALPCCCHWQGKLWHCVLYAEAVCAAAVVLSRGAAVGRSDCWALLAEGQWCISLLVTLGG